MRRKGRAKSEIYKVNHGGWILLTLFLLPLTHTCRISNQTAIIAQRLTTQLEALTSIAPVLPSTEGETVQVKGLSKVWQGALVIVALFASLNEVLYAWTGKSWYFGVGTSLTSLSLSCGLLVFFSSPANKEIELRLIAFASFVILTYICGGTIGCFRQGKNFWGWFLVACGPICAILLYFFTLMRRRIGRFSQDRLKYYISSTIFFQAMGCLPPIVYLTAESIQCVGWENNETDTCGGVIIPQVSVTLMLTFFLAVRLVLAPLTKTHVTAWQLASFSGISYKLRLQMILLGLSSFGNAVMFGIMGPGPQTHFVFYLFLVCISSILGIMFCEFVDIVFGAGSRASLASRPSNGTLQVLEVTQAGATRGFVDII